MSEEKQVPPRKEVNWMKLAVRCWLHKWTHWEDYSLGTIQTKHKELNEVIHTGVHYIQHRQCIRCGYRQLNVQNKNIVGNDPLP